MSVTPLAILPLKGFDEAKQRVELEGAARKELAEAVATHVVETCRTAGLETLVVTGSEHVKEWAARHGSESLDEPGAGGLNGAVRAGVAESLARGSGWLLVHGDLPLLQPADIDAAATAVRADEVAIAPARDGGTNLLGALHDMAFHYGPGSFHRHLHEAAGSIIRVIVRTGTATEIDDLDDLQAVASTPAGAHLARFLS